MTAKYEHELPSSFVPHTHHDSHHDSHHDASHESAHEHLSQAQAVNQAPGSESLAYHDHRHDDHTHTHDHALEHFHSHRNIIGFDVHGIPKVIVKSSHNDDEADDPQAFIKDYTKAVAEYRKTFPSKEQVLAQTPDPAVKELIIHAEDIKVQTPFDRFDAQKPHCSFGLAGVCCRICSMGPCRVTPKSPRGTCGADADLIVARNLLRAGAAGASQHGMHAREVVLSLKWAAQGKLKLPIIGVDKVKTVAQAFGISLEGKSVNELAIAVADVLLEDLGRPEPASHSTIEALAPEERRKCWEALDIIPISAYHEVFEAMHKSGCGVDGDWRSIMQQFLRCGLAFVFTGVVAASIATDCLFGVGDRVTSKVNIGAIKEGYVNIAVHGHLPTLVSAIVEAGQSEEFIARAKAAGAKGIRFYGICCSGLAAMYRYGGVIPLSNAVSAELVLATGALDLWVADVQDVFPAIMDVADCFKTTVVTTSESARLPGAIRCEYDHHHANIGETQALARRIVNMGIEAFTRRRGIPVHIPPYEIEAEVGFSLEYIAKRFGSIAPVAQALKDGRILGIVNMVGCSNTRVVYEQPTQVVTDILIKNNVLVLSNGCASFPLMKLGYCRRDAFTKAGDTLAQFLKPDLPPVWHVGECIDNARSSTIFGALAKYFGQDLKDMPFAFASPEWGNEKGINAALGFRLMGINSYHCVEAPIFGSKNVIEFLKHGTKELLGSSMNVNVSPEELANLIISDLKAKRVALGWAPTHAEAQA